MQWKQWPPVAAAMLLFATPALAQDIVGGVLAAAAPRRCAPNIDPSTGQMYPMCDPSITSRDELAAFDNSIDVYKDSVIQARREGRINRAEYRAGMALVREAREEYRNARQAF